MSFSFKAGEKKCPSSSSFFSGFCEVRRKVQPQGPAGFKAGDALEQSRPLWKSQNSSISHMCASLVLPSSLKGAYWALLGCSYSCGLAY